jgi:hypothetical protein
MVARLAQGCIIIISIIIVPSVPFKSTQKKIPASTEGRQCWPGGFFTD